MWLIASKLTNTMPLIAIKTFNRCPALLFTFFKCGFSLYRSRFVCVLELIGFSFASRNRHLLPSHPPQKLNPNTEGKKEENEGNQTIWKEKVEGAKTQEVQTTILQSQTPSSKWPWNSTKEKTKEESNL